MARTPNTRRSKSTRKPVTLDLQAQKTPKGEKAGGKVPEAEPVAFEEFQRDETQSRAAGAAGTARTAADASARDAVERGKTESARAAESTKGTSDSSASAAGSSAAYSASSPPSRSSSGGMATALAAGLLGGVLALVVAGLLQWGGILPTPRGGADLDPLQTRLDELRGDVDTLQSAGPAGTPEELQAQIDSASAAASSSQEALETLRSDMDALNQQVATLSDAVSSGDAGENAGLETLSERVNNLESTVSEMSDQASQGDASDEMQQTVTDLSGQLDQMRQRVDELAGAVDAVPGSLEERFTSIDDRLGEMSSQMTALSDRLGAVESDIDSGAGSRVAAAIAASSLKNAVDRGGEFMTELEAFSAVGGSQESVDSLRTYAASGVPTLAQLNERYPAVANRIVAATDGVGPDAGIGDRLMASARNLVKVRPVGEVEGDTPGAIAARMEVALKNGDLQRFIDQWETLPDPAKNASKEFASDVRARMRVDSLISDVLTGTMENARPAEGE